MVIVDVRQRFAAQAMLQSSRRPQAVAQVGAQRPAETVLGTIHVDNYPLIKGQK